MKNIVLSVKEHTLTDEYIPTFKKYDYVETFDFEKDEDIELLYEKVNLFVHTYYTYDSNIRSEGKFESATAIFLDFDTKNDHSDSTIDEFLQSSFARKYNWMLYTSKSHISGHQECFHVVIPLETEITDLLTLKYTYKSIFDELHREGLKCDFKVRDGARLIFPSMNMSGCEDTHFDNFCFDCYRGGKYVESVYPTMDDIENEIGIIDRLDDNEDDYDPLSENIDDYYIKTFKSMNLSSRVNYIRSILMYMNRQNIESKYKRLDYNDWIAIGYSLYAIFGYSIGLKLFKILQHPNDTEESVSKQFGYLYNENHTLESSFSSILRMSFDIGYSHIIYIRYYYAVKHNFNNTESLVYYNRMINLMLDDMGYDAIDHNNVKIYKYTSKRKARKFMMELSLDGYKHPIKISMGYMKKIMSKIFDIPVEFITGTITNGIIRKFINMNGIYDITGMIRESVLRKIVNIEPNGNGYIPVSDVKNVIAHIRANSPSTIHKLTNTKSMEKELIDSGIIVDKKSERFIVNGSRKQCIAYKIDRSKIITSTL